MKSYIVWFNSECFFKSSLKLIKAGGCIVLLLFTLNSWAQTKDTVYYSENYKVIKRSELNKRFQSDLFYRIHLNTDSLYYIKLKYKEFYGQFGTKENQQQPPLLN